MPNITIEHAIMLPILLLQVFLFPIALNIMASAWTDARRENTIKDAADHLGSMIQQLYFCLNQKEISTGNVTLASTLPPMIESYPYTAVVDSLVSLGLNSSKILTLTLTLQEAGNTATATITLGPNVEWEGGTFISNSPAACIKVRKSDDALFFSFG